MGENLMAAPWEKYQQAEANPWEKYTAPVKTSPQVLQARAAQGDQAAAQEFAARYKASTGEDYKPVSAVNPNAFTGFDSNMMAAAGSTLGDTGNGIMQNAIEGGPMGNMVKAGFNAIGIQQPKNPLQDWIQSRIAEKRSLDAPMLDAPGGTSGAIAGNVAQFVGPGMATKMAAIKLPALTGLAEALAPTTYTGNALLGGVMGAIQPRTADESQAKNIAVGSGFGVLGRSLGDVVRAPFIAGRYAKDMLSKGGAESRVAKDLVSMGVSQNPTLQQALPEFNLNSAQATQDPIIAALTRARRGRPEFMGPLTERLRDNQRQADEIIANLAGTPEDVANLIAARKAATSPLYSEAGKYEGVNTRGVVRTAERGAARLEGYDGPQQNMINVADGLMRKIPENVRLSEAKQTLKQWMEGGSRRSSEDTAAITEAHRILNMRNQTAEESLALLKKIKPSSVAAQDALKDAIKTLKTNAKPEDRAFVLKNRMDELKDLIAGKGVAANNTQKAADRNLIPVLERLKLTMKKQIPEFAQAEKTFADMSGPVNQKQVLQAIANRSKDSFGRTSLGSLDGAIRADKMLVKSQTGLKNKSLSDILTPDQKTKLFGVRDYLRLAGDAEKLGGGANSQTGQNLSLLGNVAQKQANIWLNKVPLLKTFGEVLDAKSKAVYEDALDKALQNPQGLIDVLGKLPPAERAKALDVLKGLSNRSSLLLPAAKQKQENRAASN